MPAARGTWQAKSTPPILRSGLFMPNRQNSDHRRNAESLFRRHAWQKQPIVSEAGAGADHIHSPTSNLQPPTPELQTRAKRSTVLFRPTTTSSRSFLLNRTHDTQLQPLQTLPKHHNPHIIPPLQNPPLDPLKPDFPKLQVQKLVF